MTAKPNGIILITPESFESLMMNHNGWCLQAFSDLCTIIIDEFHAFNEVVQTILQSKIHVIACLRVKTEYVLQEETNSKGKSVQVPKKVGLAPVMRDNIEYEFSTVLDVGMDHQCTPSKDRTGLFVGKTFQINEGTGELIAGWLSGNQEQTDHCTETEHFLKMIHDAGSKDALGKIVPKIKASKLSDSDKEIIRKAYKERSNSLV